MILKSKICGVSDSKTLNFVVNHQDPPQFIGFVVNYQKSKRYIDLEKLKKIITINKKNSFYVAVLVDPDEKILEEIKVLPFDYYQLYDCSVKKTQIIKNLYNKKIISAFTVSNQDDIDRYKDFEDITDMLLFDSKGYELSESFNHELLNNVNTSKPIMVAGDIKTNDLVKFKDTPYLIDISGHLESKKGVKDLNKIDKFLNTVHNINL